MLNRATGRESYQQHSANKNALANNTWKGNPQRRNTEQSEIHLERHGAKSQESFCALDFTLSNTQKLKQQNPDSSNSISGAVCTGS